MKPLRTPTSTAAWSFALLGFGLATVTHADPDLWGHVRFGLDALATHSLPAIDPYSFTQDRAWLNHEWLSEIVMAAAYQGMGTLGLRLLKAAIVVCSFALVWRAYRGTAWPAKLAATAWLAFGAVHMIATVRPQLWSLLFTIAIARQLVVPSRHAYWGLPVLFGLWANLHGGWIVGLGIVGLWVAFGGVVEAGKRTYAWAMAGACALATLATPDGVRLWAFIWETVQFERNITEWRPLWEGASAAEWTAWIATVALGLWTVRASRGRDLARAAVLILLAVLAFRVMRIGSLFAAVALVFASAWVRRAWPAQETAEVPRGPAVAATALALFPLAARGHRLGPDHDSYWLHRFRGAVGCRSCGDRGAAFGAAGPTRHRLRLGAVRNLASRPAHSGVRRWPAGNDLLAGAPRAARRGRDGHRIGIEDTRRLAAGLCLAAAGGTRNPPVVGGTRVHDRRRHSTIIRGRENTAKCKRPFT